ncbi:MAG: cysteine peptidase family C39 domain-containing protein, partial [Candidatus Omnitrophica bacterium]|nr:cysteine peptidase family C39 domain-containing protein [Candidatus Omnitrophota bacterium]
MAVFLPEQAAQAAQYNWQAIWNQPVAYKPLLADSGHLDIPVAVKNILTEVAGKSLTNIQLSPNLTLHLNEPLQLSRDRIEEIYQWLQGKPCGSKTLFDLLALEGVPVLEQDIAVLALTVDILNNVVKPVGSPAIIKTSLFALAKTAQFFNVSMYAAKIEDFRAYAESFAPFIAHLKGDHYVFVTHIKDSKVYFIDEHKESFLPIEKFRKDFSGYALIPESHTAKSSVVLVPDEEAKGVLGAGSSRRDGIEDNLGLLFGTFIAPAFPKISTSSFSTLVRNYAVTYAMPKMMKGLGANQTWQNIGGAFLSGAAIGGMQANGKVFGLSSKSWAAALQTGSVWATSAAVQEYGYTQKWDTGKYGFIGATYLASQIAGNAVEYGFGKAGIGYWQIDQTKNIPTWQRKGFDGSAFISKYGKESLGRAIELVTQNVAENNWNWARYPEYSRAVGGFAKSVAGGDSVVKAALTSALNGVVSAGMQSFSKQHAALNPYTNAFLSMGMTAALYAELSKIGPDSESRSRTDLFKEMLNTNSRTALGNLFSGGTAILDKKGNLVYSEPLGGSFAANMVDFNRQTNGLANAAWTKDEWSTFLKTGQAPKKDSLFGVFSERLISNVFSQATSNVSRVIVNRLSGVYNEKYGQDWFEI